MPPPSELQRQADALHWFHSIDLGDGVLTKGDSDGPIPTSAFPSFEGRSVLDIGAWDGYYSFLAERSGARAVTALDHYVWGVDFDRRNAYWNRCFAEGVLPDHDRDTTEFWDADLPGRRSFEFAAESLGSKVRPVVLDFATADLADLGTFDVVLYLGVLYHMKEPLTCLERLRSVTGEVAVIETEAIHLQHHDDECLLRFHQGGDLHTDFGNWFVPTIAALHALCRAAGFGHVETVLGPPAAPPPRPAEPMPARTRRRRGVPEPEAPAEAPTSAPSARYRAVVRAFV